MNLTTTREKVRKSEAGVVWLSLAVVLVVLGLYLHQGIFHLAFLLGYGAGVLGFFALSLTFSYVDKLPGWFRIIAILSSSFKILLLFALALVLKLLGFSIVEVVIGLLASQLVIILALLIIVYTDRKSVEISNRNNKTDACS